MEQLGHSQISLTMGTYADGLPDVLRRDADGGAALLDAAKEPASDGVAATVAVKPPSGRSLRPLGRVAQRKAPDESGAFRMGRGSLELPTR